MFTHLHHQQSRVLSAKAAWSVALFEAGKGSTNSLCGQKRYFSPGPRRGVATQGRRAGQQVKRLNRLKVLMLDLGSRIYYNYVFR